MDIGEKIRTARLAKGMTQEELGKRLGVQKSAIAKYESGRVVNIKRSTLKKISEILCIRPAELIGDVEQEKPAEDNGLSENVNALIEITHFPMMYISKGGVRFEKEAHDNKGKTQTHGGNRRTERAAPQGICGAKENTRKEAA